MRVSGGVKPDREDGTYTMVAFSGKPVTRLRGRQIEWKEVMLERFQKNGAILLSHDGWEMPIGTATALGYSDKNELRVSFKLNESDPRYEAVKGALESGTVKAMSVGLGLELTPKALRKLRRNADYEVKPEDWGLSLYEISLVSLPADLNAVTNGRVRLCADDDRCTALALGIPDSDEGWDASVLAQLPDSKPTAEPVTLESDLAFDAVPNSKLTIMELATLAAKYATASEQADAEPLKPDVRPEGWAGMSVTPSRWRNL